MKHFFIITIAVCLGLFISHLISNKHNAVSTKNESNDNKVTVHHQTIDYAEDQIKSNDIADTSLETESQLSKSTSTTRAKKKLLSQEFPGNSAQLSPSHAFQNGWNQQNYKQYLDFLNKAYGLKKNPSNRRSLIKNISNFDDDHFINFAREVLRDEKTIENYLSSLVQIEEKAQPNFKTTLMRQVKEKLIHQILQELSRIDSIAELKY